MSSRRIVAASMAATAAGVYPGFLIAALSVQVSAEFEVTPAVYGWGLGSFFLAATLASAPSGQVAQRVDPRRQAVAALTACAAAQLLIAVAASSFGFVVACLAVCGFANSFNQTAINLMLSTAQLQRLGLAVSLKQSAMPIASLMSGLAVPAFALTVGWRWSFAFAAMLPLAAALGLRRAFAAVEPVVETLRPRPLTPIRVLAATTAGVALLAFGAGGLNAWAVASGVDAGLSEGMAGVMLSLGAGTGITVRLLAGLRMDSMARSRMRTAAVLAVLGALGTALMAGRVSALHIAATVLAFGAGWAWPVFTNYSVIRANADAAGAATGITQTGVYVGVFCAPLVTGTLIEWQGYPLMWTVVAAAMVAGAGVIAAMASHY